MRPESVSSSAAALLVGALTAVLGFSLSPLPPDPELGEAALAAAGQGAQLGSSVILLFLAALGLSAGTVALVFLLRDQSRYLAGTAAAAFLVGCIGMAVQAMLVAFGTALVEEDAQWAARLDEAVRDPVVQALLLSRSVGLLGGLLLFAAGLWRARTVPRWVPVAFVVFVASQLSPLPDSADAVTVQFVLLAVALAGVAFAANEQSHRVTATHVSSAMSVR